MLDRPAEKRILLFLLALAVVAGIWARVAHLDRKLFFEDETITAVRSSGHGMDGFVRLFDGKVHSVGQIMRYVQRDPATGVGTVLQTLEREDPHHAPLFYVIESLTLDAFGPGSATMFRAPSVAIGIAGIGCAFAFGAKLFRSKMAGGVLAALVAVSPFHILYSRQAREYSLFTSLVFASSYCLLLAFEGGSVLAWAAYAATLVLGMYTDPIFGVVIASQAVFCIVTARERLRTLGAFACAAALGVASFSPWALNTLHASASVADQLAWGENAYPLKLFVQKWAFNIGAVFFDAEFADLRLTFVAVIVIAIVLASFFSVVRGGDDRVRAIGLPLAVIPMVPFLVFDLTHGGHFSTIPRYLTAGWTGVEVVVAGALAAGLKTRSRFTLPAFAFLILAGSFSAVVDNRAENWWDNNNNVAFRSAAREIDAAARPLVILGPNYEIAPLIARYLDPDASLLLLPTEDAPPLPRGAAHVFALIPSQHLLASLHGRTRGTYVMKNISPPPPSVIASFHHTLHSDATFKNNGALSLSPDDALWALTRR